MRAAAEAIALSWLSTDSARVSSSTPSANGARDREHRRAREVQLALGVAVDVAGEGEVGQPVQQPLVGQPLLAQGGQLLVAEAEVGQRVQQPAGAGDHAVAAAVRQPPGEDLEDAVAASRCRRPAPPPTMVSS